jgi:predicted DNA-binding protein with PD1-like motif
MQNKEMKNIIFIRLFENEDLNEKIKEACRLNGVKTAVVLSGIGQIKSVKLGFFKNKGDYSPKEFNKPMEILSISGNVCRQNDEYLLHLHAVLGDENKIAIGGHLIEAKINITGEIVLLNTPIDVNRKLDTKTGLQALFLE